MSELNQPMIGRTCPTGPGGRDCTCCGQAPGRSRKIARRSSKRSDKHNWRLQAHTEL